MANDLATPLVPSLPRRRTGAGGRGSWLGIFGWPGQTGRPFSRHPGPWGADLAGLSAADLCLSSRGWDDVCADDLVLLFPTLLWQSRSAHADPAEAHVAAAIADARSRLDACTSDGDTVAARHLDGIFDALKDRTLRNDADATLAALATGMHPGYADGRLACLADTLTAAAWLAQLVAGRRAYLIAPIADMLHDLLGSAPSPHDCALHLIREAAAAAGGPDGLLELAQRVRCDRRARLVIPRCAPSLADLARAHLATARDSSSQAGCPRPLPKPL